MTTTRSSLLPWIVAFKAIKATALTAAGLSLLLTRHDDPVDLMVRLALTLHLPLTSELFDRAWRFATHLTVGKQVALGTTALAYAVLMGTEGIGLYLHRHWARWLTIVATSSLVPIEVYEIVREPHLLRVLVLVANVAIVMYVFRRREIFED